MWKLSPEGASFENRCSQIYRWRDGDETVVREVIYYELAFQTLVPITKGHRGYVIRLECRVIGLNFGMASPSA